MSSDMFLTEAEVIEATGCTQPAAQARWFQKRGLNVHRNKANVVQVSREAYVRWQLGEMSETGRREPVMRLRAAA